MSFPLFANILTMILCFAVLVQSIRMMRSLRKVDAREMLAVVSALDQATAQARAVLGGLRTTLEGDAAGVARAVGQGAEIRDELRMLIEIAESMAERLAGGAGGDAAEEAVAAIIERLPPELEPQPAREPQSAAARHYPSVTPKMTKADLADSLAELRKTLSQPSARERMRRVEAA